MAEIIKKLFSKQNFYKQIDVFDNNSFRKKILYNLTVFNFLK